MLKDLIKVDETIIQFRNGRLSFVTQSFYHNWQVLFNHNSESERIINDSCYNEELLFYDNSANDCDIIKIIELEYNNDEHTITPNIVWERDIVYE